MRPVFVLAVLALSAGPDAARAVPAAAAAPAAPTLAEVVTPGMLRVPIGQLEARTGPARQSYDAGNGFVRRSYLVQGCALDAYARDGKVESYGLPLTPDCTVDLTPFLPGRPFPSANRMDLADFIAVAGPGDAPDAPGSFRSMCLERCGGGADPAVSYLRRGNDAERFIEIEVTAAVDDSRSSAAAGRLARSIGEREGVEYVREARFSCDGRYAAAGILAFRAVRLSFVRIGYGIDAYEGWLMARCPGLRKQAA